MKSSPLSLFRMVVLPPLSSPLRVRYQHLRGASDLKVPIHRKSTRISLSFRLFLRIIVSRPMSQMFGKASGGVRETSRDSNKPGTKQMNTSNPAGDGESQRSQ